MIIWILVFIGFAVDIAFIITDYKKMFGIAVILKALASLVFVYVGYLCSQIGQNEIYGLLITAGLILGTGGDVFLNIRFVFINYDMVHFKIGTGFFFFGHIAYIITAIALIPSTVYYGVPIAIVLIPLVAIKLIKMVETSNELKYLGVIYFTVMISTFAFGVALLIKSGFAFYSIVFATGSLFFMVSDILYVLTQFGIIKRIWYNGANLITYYIGQMLIALSIMFS